MCVTISSLPLKADIRKQAKTQLWDFLLWDRPNHWAPRERGLALPTEPEEQPFRVVT